jgi:hypothetical protein
MPCPYDGYEGRGAHDCSGPPSEPKPELEYALPREPLTRWQLVYPTVLFWTGFSAFFAWAAYVLW